MTMIRWTSLMWLTETFVMIPRFETNCASTSRETVIWRSFPFTSKVRSKTTTVSLLQKATTQIEAKSDQKEKMIISGTIVLAICYSISKAIYQISCSWVQFSRGRIVAEWTQTFSMMTKAENSLTQICKLSKIKLVPLLVTTIRSKETRWSHWRTSVCIINHRTVNPQTSCHNNFSSPSNHKRKRSNNEKAPLALIV